MNRNRKMTAMTKQARIRFWSRENEQGASQMVATLLLLGTDSTIKEGRLNGLRRSHGRSRLADSPWH